MRLHTFGTPSRLLVWLALVVSILVMNGTPASAHTGFESSSPGDGDIVNEPLDELSLTFSGEAMPAGDGFVVLDPGGSVRVPDDVTSTDNLTWTLRFDDALAGGEVGVRWSVAAPDAHPIDGSFSFTVLAEATVASTTTTTTAATDTAPSTAPLQRIDEVEPVTEMALDDFLETSSDTARGAALLATSSRILRLVGAVGAIGGIFFAAFVLRGDPRDIRAVLFLVRRAGVIIIVGAITQVIARIATAAQGWAGLWSVSTIVDVLWSSLGAAIALRMLGGLMVLVGARLNTHEAAGATDHVAAFKQDATVGTALGAPAAIAPRTADATNPLAHEGDEAWQMSDSPVAFAGLGLLALSFLFDGHTVSEGPRWLHAVSNVVHVMTAATWAGGVVMLAIVVARRHRRGADLRALQLGARFSVVAIVALVAAAVAGTALTILILDSVSAIWTTSWGRLLVLKVLLVGAAGIGGGYNHRVIIPALERAPDDEILAHRFRTVVSLEAACVVAVTVVTALLIAASAS